VVTPNLRFLLLLISSISLTFIRLKFHIINLSCVLPRLNSELSFGSSIEFPMDFDLYLTLLTTVDIVHLRYLNLNNYVRFVL